MARILLSLICILFISSCVQAKSAYILLGEDFRCTAFPIDTDLFITPRHCFNGKTKSNSTVLIQDGNENTLGSVVAVFLPRDKYDRDLFAIRSGDVQNDFVVLKTSFEVDPSLVFNVGVVSEQSYLFVVDELGNSEKVLLEVLHEQMLFVKYNGKQGMSGRPVLNKEGQVVGMLVAISEDISVITRMDTAKSDFILHVKQLQ